LHRFYKIAECDTRTNILTDRRLYDN